LRERSARHNGSPFALQRPQGMMFLLIAPRLMTDKTTAPPTPGHGPEPAEGQGAPSEPATPRSIASVLAPGLLLASPALGDAHFEKTVVLLGQHDETGAMGWVINGEGILPVRDLLESSGLVAKNTSFPGLPSFEQEARFGGPVDRSTGWLLYRQGSFEDQAQVNIGETLAITGNNDTLMATVRGEGPDVFRLLVGYSGWGPGQLESEIQQGAWLPGPVDAELIFDVPMPGLWEKAYERTVGASPAVFAPNRRGLA